MTDSVSTEELRSRIRSLVEKQGEAKTVQMLGVSRLAFARVLAGLPVRTGTLLVVETELEKVGEL